MLFSLSPSTTPAPTQLYTLSLHDALPIFASGDSRTSARLVPVCPTALRLTACRDPVAHHMILFEKVRRMAHVFDVVHFHTEDRKSTRLNSSHVSISYAVFCLKKKKSKTTI